MGIFAWRLSIFAMCAFLPIFSFGQSTVSTQVALPKTLEQGKDEPACGAPGPTTADQFVQEAGRIVDNFVIGAPIVSNVMKNNTARNWVKSRLGINNGPAACAMMCVTIPAKAKVVKTDACVQDGQSKPPKNCNESSGNSNIYTEYWGGVRAAGEKVIGRKKVVCTLAKHWSHDRDRIISWRVWYK